MNIIVDPLRFFTSYLGVNPSYGCNNGCGYCMLEKDMPNPSKVRRIMTPKTTLDLLLNDEKVTKTSPLAFYNLSDPFHKENASDLLQILEGLEKAGHENIIALITKLNPEKTYFSSKSSTERLRITKLIKKEETVLVMFSGVAPYPLTIAKHSKAKEIYGVESNPDAHELGLQNIALNKFKNILLYKGDVRRVLPKIKKKFDRIIMPHPSDSEAYLRLAKSKLKPKGKIHMYIFEKEENFKELKKKYKKYKPKLVKAGSPSPGKFRVCLDLKTQIN